MKKIILFVFIFALFFVSVSAQVAVIVNKSVSESSFDASQLEDIYMLKTTKWADGSKIVVFNLKTKGEVQTKFYNYINANANDLKKAWMRAQLTGEAKAPESLGSEEEIVMKVAATSGAIGFISVASVSNNVKTIATIQ